jgi:3D-(3,5/4)-trihydroxycyclohexane-1,2-dione acylhydrolase (decyclizing)
LREGLVGARGADGPVVVYIEADRYKGVPSYESWWDVPVAEVSEEDGVRAAREAYDRDHEHQRQYLRSRHD